MIQYSLRVAKRFILLIPGIAIAFLSVETIFPYFDARLPLGFALLVTYILGAYVLVPAIIRIFRAVRPTNHLPLYCVTPDGFASDPLNIGILATRRELMLTMEKAGWHVADPHSLRNVFKQLTSTLLGNPYPTAPVSSLYLFGRKQDLAFEIPISGSLGSRHHVRFWATTHVEGKRLSAGNIHWHNRRAHLQADSLLWVGAASLDNGITFIRHNFQVSHMIHPDTDLERSVILKQLEAVKLVRKINTIKLGDPYRLVNRVWRGYLQTDGKMSIVTLASAKNNRE